MSSSLLFQNSFLNQQGVDSKSQIYYIMSLDKMPTKNQQSVDLSKRKEKWSRNGKLVPRKTSKKPWFSYYQRKGLIIFHQRFPARTGINRGTFYLHYQDKYQMVDSLKKEIISQLSSYSMFEAENAYPKKLMIAKFHILRANERLINAPTRSHYIDFQEAIREYITSIILSDKQRMLPSVF